MYALFAINCVNITKLCICFDSSRYFVSQPLLLHFTYTHWTDTKFDMITIGWKSNDINNQTIWFFFWASSFHFIYDYDEHMRFLHRKFCFIFLILNSRSKQHTNTHAKQTNETMHNTIKLIFFHSILLYKCNKVMINEQTTKWRRNIAKPK